MALVFEPNHVIGWKETVMALMVEPNDNKEWWDKPNIKRDRHLFDGWGNLLVYRIPSVWSEEDFDGISYGADGTPGG